MRRQTFWLGIFLVLSFGVVAWILLFLHPSLGNGERALRVRFANIEKISLGTRVTYAGKPVGEVAKIEEIPDARRASVNTQGEIYTWELTLRVDSSVEVYNTDQVLFQTSGLLGEKSVAIIPHAALPGQPSCVIDDHVIYGRSTDELQESLKTVSNAAIAFEEVMHSVSAFICRNQDEIAAMIASFRHTSDSLRQLIDEILPPMVRIADHLEHIMARLDAGEGTVGKLLRSEELYQNLNDALIRADLLIDDMRQYGIFFSLDRNWKRRQKEQGYE